jgi:cytosine/adenosine deaminase-related metal-dependent hydrolase
LPEGWAHNVCLSIEDGLISDVEIGVECDGATHVRGPAVPGLPNLHCHAFQRGMAGLAERRGPGDDSFWTWRDVMYHFLGRLTPDDVEAIAAFACLEMLRQGFTSVGEFHYIDHDTNGMP